MKFIRINDSIYSTAIIQRITRNNRFIALHTLDGAKTKQVDVHFDNQEKTDAVFNEIVKELENKKELFTLKSKEAD